MIDDRIFVAIVVMALATSLLAGPAMNLLLDKRAITLKLSSDSLHEKESRGKAA